MSTRYDEDILENAAIGYQYPNGNLMQIDLERSRTFETLDFDAMQTLLGVGPFGDQKLNRLFGNRPRDFFLSGLVESEDTGDMGETFATVIMQQFFRIRHADWKWFENFELNNVLNPEAVRNISNTSFR